MQAGILGKAQVLISGQFAEALILTGTEPAEKSAVLDAFPGPLLKAPRLIKGEAIVILFNRGGCLPVDGNEEHDVRELVNDILAVDGVQGRVIVGRERLLRKRGADGQQDEQQDEQRGNKLLHGSLPP